jgi:hypothetical protein
MQIIILNEKTAYRPVDTTKGLRLINQAYLTPLMSKADVMTLHERLTSDGRLNIVARVGLFVAGAIQPTVITEDGTVELYRMLYERAKYSQECAQKDAVRIVDKDTGELVDREGGAA